MFSLWLSFSPRQHELQETTSWEATYSMMPLGKARSAKGSAAWVLHWAPIGSGENDWGHRLMGLTSPSKMATWRWKFCLEQPCAALLNQLDYKSLTLGGMHVLWETFGVFVQCNIKEIELQFVTLCMCLQPCIESNNDKLSACISPWIFPHIYIDLIGLLPPESN